MTDFNPETKNKHMRRMAYASLMAIIVMTVNGVVTGSYPPEYVYLSFTGLIIGWQGFSKWGEISDSKVSSSN